MTALIELLLWAAVAVSMTHVTIEHAFDRARYIRAARQFLADRFGRDDGDEDLAARSWLTTLLWMAAGTVGAWAGVLGLL